MSEQCVCRNGTTQLKEPIQKNHSNEKEEWRLILHIYSLAFYVRPKSNKCLYTTECYVCMYVCWGLSRYEFILQCWAHFNTDVKEKLHVYGSRVGPFQISLKLHIMFFNLLWFVGNRLFRLSVLCVCTRASSWDLYVFWN